MYGVCGSAVEKGNDGKALEMDNGAFEEEGGENDGEGDNGAVGCDDERGEVRGDEEDGDGDESGGG